MNFVRVLLCSWLLIGTSLYAQTDIEATVSEDQTTLSISIEDDGRIPFFEAGELWKLMKGFDQRKFLMEEGFSLECNAFRNSREEIYGKCLLNIETKKLQKIGELQVFKLKGASANKLNRYFSDNAYWTAQGGRIYLSSYSARREFYFGIQDNLIKR